MTWMLWKIWWSCSTPKPRGRKTPNTWPPTAASPPRGSPTPTRWETAKAPLKPCWRGSLAGSPTGRLGTWRRCWGWWSATMPLPSSPGWGRDSWRCRCSPCLALNHPFLQHYCQPSASEDSLAREPHTHHKESFCHKLPLSWELLVWSVLSVSVRAVFVTPQLVSSAIIIFILYYIYNNSVFIARLTHMLFNHHEHTWSLELSTPPASSL